MIAYSTHLSIECSQSVAISMLACPLRVLRPLDSHDEPYHQHPVYPFLSSPQSIGHGSFPVQSGPRDGLSNPRTPAPIDPSPH